MIEIENSPRIFFGALPERVQCSSPNNFARRFRGELRGCLS